jgi:hypothetical protein
MSDFLDGLKQDDEEQPTSDSSLRAIASTIRPTGPKPRPNVELSDAMAVRNGFSSREPTSSELPLSFQRVGRRRTARPTQLDRKQLSVYMTPELYADFLAYADRKRLTYSEAIQDLLYLAKSVGS